MFLKTCFVTISILFTIACGSGPGEPEADKADTSRTSTQAVTQTNDSASVPVTGLEIEPGIRKTDSLQVLYFDNPDGDSLRYTRFYTYLTSGDPAFTNLILSNLDKSFVKLPSVKKCRSEGKIFMYAGDDPVKTLYFSTRADTCSYLYMISTGEFIYFKLDDSLRNQLKASRKMAKTP